MSNTKRRSFRTGYKKKDTREECPQSVPGRIVADHGEYRRDIGGSDDASIDWPPYRKRLKRLVSHVRRNDEREVIKAQITEAMYEKET